ncbi:hypothetical protein BHM03_00029934 [Ensete ventricosum]|nr:hypothetical protein BHM03_00029934 [Ensete ventricosum]
MNPKECVAVPQQPTTPAMQEDCSRESKRLKPEIRVVHVSSPVIIKTDAANFREIVQRLTGKPTIGIGKNKKKTKKKKKKKKKTKTLCMTTEGEVPPRGKPVEVMGGQKEKNEEVGCGEGAKRGSEVEETRELWEEKNSACFSGKFGEIDSFLQELSDAPL